MNTGIAVAGIAALVLGTAACQRIAAIDRSSASGMLLSLTSLVRLLTFRRRPISGDAG